MQNNRKSPSVRTTGYFDDANNFSNNDNKNPEQLLVANRFDIKQLAPYGKELQSITINGQVPSNDVFLFIGNYAWSKAKVFQSHQYVLVLPDELNDPELYFWPVKDCSVLVFETTFVETAIIKKLGRVLLSSGALIIRFCLLNERMLIYSWRSVQ